MSELKRVWMPWPPEGYAAVVAADYEQYVALGNGRLHFKPLAATWRAPTLEWHRSKKKDKTPDLRCLYTATELCLRRSTAELLFPSSTANLEFLPARIESDENWVLLNCFRKADVIDFASSDLWIIEGPDCPPFIGDIRWINIVDSCTDAEEWDVFCIHSVANASAYPLLLCTDVFVDRVRSLGLGGMEFRHVGYIVPDASHAVPKPPAPPLPPPKPSKRKPPKLTSGPLLADEQIEIASVGAEWRQILQLAADASSQTILQRITEEMQKLRPVFWTISAEERLDASLGLSAIYGELLRSACGWSWAELRESRSKRWIAMLAPSGTHALALVPYVQQQIQSEAPTVALLFNMIVAGDLPPTEPGQLVTVG
jgi:hypothetical protein